ncbi:MAG: PH domain-containing protein [Actinophytocola sp.]|uniref:PH domain-containing protein n=1 Tax=Actinophytocola sp. TaxID=1872138 RepID=UPI001325ED63|nr:PH domain-containing protein [Actinophytocola sp.]MPZ85894.1 PH domain-containing protein [Actinophytocola sp.]
MTSPQSPPTARTWAPKIELAALAWALAVAAALWAAFADDPPGRVLLGTVALVFALAGLFGVVARPRLTADPDGVTVRGLTGRRRWTWAEVNVRLVRTRRLGRDVATIELDADNAVEPALIVLGRLDVGTDPEDVVAALLELRT